MQVPHIHLSGARREIGLAQGIRIRGLRFPSCSTQDVVFGAKCREIVAQWHPRIEEEFDGMCNGSGLPREAFTSYYFGRTAPAAGGCTNIAVTAERSAAGTTLVGRNYDWDYLDRRWCEARTIAPLNERTRIGYTHHWGGLCDAMNDAGLTVCIASLPSGADLRPGIQWHIAVDLVASACATAPEAADLLERIPHVRSLGYLVADGETARLVEAAPDSVTVHAPVEGVLVGTNTRTAELDLLPDNPSAHRRKRAEEWLRSIARPVEQSDIACVLADHHGGICAGDHNVDATGGGTIWSLMATPAQREISVAPGHPCDTAFEKLTW